MAKNKVFQDGRQLSYVCTDPATPASGDPAICGQIAGVALENERADGTTPLDREGVYRLSVKGTTGSNSAVAPGDKLYYVSADTPKISKTTSGVFFGWALEAVTSGATATIRVLLSGGSHA